MAGGDPSEVLAVLGRRGDLLRELASGPREKQQLEASLDVSRSTIDRGIRELEQLGLVERADGGYRRTLCGELALEEYEGVRERLGGLCEGASLLAEVDVDADLDVAMLAGATVVEADRTSPHRPVEELYGIVESATAVRGFAPAVHPQQVETYRRKVAEDGLTAELVLTKDVIEYVISTYAREFEDTVESDGVALWQAAGDLPYGLIVAETPDGPVAAVTVYADQGVLGCFHNDDRAAVEWAERRYERERRQAIRLA